MAEQQFCPLCDVSLDLHDGPDSRPDSTPERVCLLTGEHDAHDWWYTSSGGGHMLADPISDEDLRRERDLKKWHCPGRPGSTDGREGERHPDDPRYLPCSHECNGCPTCDPGLRPAPRSDAPAASEEMECGACVTGIVWADHTCERSTADERMAPCAATSETAAKASESSGADSSGAHSATTGTPTPSPSGSSKGLSAEAEPGITPPTPAPAASEEGLARIIALAPVPDDLPRGATLRVDVLSAARAILASDWLREQYERVWDEGWASGNAEWLGHGVGDINPYARAEDDS